MSIRATVLGLAILLVALVITPVTQADAILGVPQLKLSSNAQPGYQTITISSLGTTSWTAQAGAVYWVLNDTGYNWTDLHVSVTGWPASHDFGCDPHSIFSSCVIDQNGSTTPSWDFYGVGGGYSGVPDLTYFDMHFSFGTPSIPGASDYVQWSLTPSIPEPSTLLLFASGLAVLATWRKRR